MVATDMSDMNHGAPRQSAPAMGVSAANAFIRPRLDSTETSVRRGSVIFWTVMVCAAISMVWFGF